MFPKEFYEHVVVTPLTPYDGDHAQWQDFQLKDETKQVTHSFNFRGNFHR